MEMKQRAVKATRAEKRRLTVISACTVYVSCPQCGEPQPSPVVGSEFWTVIELDQKMKSGKLDGLCVACDEPFHFDFPMKVLR